MVLHIHFKKFLTVKSDDVVGRVKTYEAIVKGENVPEPGVPESFKVLIKELQSLGLDVKMLSGDEEEIEMRDMEDEDDLQQADTLNIVPETQNLNLKKLVQKNN